MNQVQIIADSISPQGHRITTFICTFWRALLAEVNTHRMLTRNSASSRAIPFKKMVEKVQNDPFIPMKWMKEHTGMQGTEFFTSDDVIEIPDSLYGGKMATIKMLEMSWLNARNSAIVEATYLDSLGVSKQICNRLLEPFLHHTALITGTEFENFFALRAHPQAEIHFADLAQKMLDVYNANEPKQLKVGDWHLPFGDKIRDGELAEILSPGKTLGENSRQIFIENHLKIATARCARISYGTFEGKDDYEADIKLHDRLLASGHLSPFEHCAKVMSDSEYELNYNGKLINQKFGEHNVLIGDPNSEAYGWSANFHGFIPYRKLFPNENLKDPRVKHYG